MEKNPDMDISGLMDKHKDFKNRLKYWTHKYCTEHPHLFDLVITVSIHPSKHRNFNPRLIGDPAWR